MLAPGSYAWTVDALDSLSAVMNKRFSSVSKIKCRGRTISTSTHVHYIYRLDFCPSAHSTLRRQQQLMQGCWNIVTTKLFVTGVKELYGSPPLFSAHSPDPYQGVARKLAVFLLQLHFKLPHNTHYRPDEIRVIFDRVCRFNRICIVFSWAHAGVASILIEAHA